MKRRLNIIVAALFITIPFLGHSQASSTWSANLAGNGTAANTDGTVTITSSIQSVDGGNPQFIQYNNFSATEVNDFSGNYNGIDINGVNLTLSSVPVAKRLRAQAGIPFSITINTSKKRQVTGTNATDFDNVRLKYGIGKNEQPYRYDVADYNGSTGTFTSDGNPITQSFSISHTFTVGRTEAWIVLELYEGATIYTFSGGFGGSFNITSYSASTSIVIPIVVEGATDGQVDSLGVTTKPQVPQMVIHTPPGDGSSTTVTNTGRKCRKFEETYSKDQSGTLYGALKLGYKGSIGFVATVDVEAYVEFSASGTAGAFQTRTSNEETCVTVSNSLTALSAGKGAQGNDLFMGYGIDLVYGVSRNVSIQNNVAVVDTSVIYRPLPETLREFFLTKSGIEDDILNQQAILNDSINNSVAQRATAQYQIDVWQQVLDQNNANIAAAASQTGESKVFDGLGNQTYNTGIAYTNTQTINVGHYLSGSFGIEGAAYIGGSGFKQGVKFTTSQRFGEFQSVSGGQSQDVAVTLYDGDEGDHFEVKIVKDPVYGTPIFILDSALSKSSCPYEGGVQRDLPSLKIYTSTARDTTISNVTLGTAGHFQVQVCNNSNESRDYGLGFVSQSATGNLLIKSNSSTGTVNTENGITQFGTITNVPAGGCTVGIFDISMARDINDAGAPMSYENVEFVSFVECEPKLRSSVLANINFAGPPPPTGVTASKTEICTGTPVTLTASCPVTTTPRWYTLLEKGFPILEGESVVVNPATSSTYYVGCETSNYKRDRVATPLILVGSPSSVLNLTSDFSSNSLQIANTTLIANSKVNSPARVKYKAGNSLTFNPGFEAKGGSTFEAEIGGCTN